MRIGNIYISTITEAELFGYSALTDREHKIIDSILSTLSIIPVDSHLARSAGLIRRRYALKIPDTIIAATTLFTDSTLITRNVKDFDKINELRLLKI